MTSRFSDMMFSDIISLVKFNNWPKLHVNIINGSAVMTIFSYKGLTRNWEIEKTPV